MIQDQKMPEGWQKVKFGDTVRNVRETERDPLSAGLERYVGLEHIEPENLHIREWGLVAEGTSFTRRFAKGQVLFGKRRAYQRKVAVAEFDGVCSGDILVFEPKDNRLLPELLPFIVQSEGFFANALRTSSGSLSPRTRWRDLAAYEFPLPPLDEQRRIAEILWAADQYIQKQESVLSALRYLQRLFFESWLSENSLSFDWPGVSLKDVCTIQSGQVDPTTLPYSDMIHIAPDDIECETGRILEKNTAAADGVTSGKYEFAETAILYSKIRPNLRKVAFPRFQGVCSADVYPVYAANNILPGFLFRILLSDGFTAYAIANSVRSAIPKINRPAMLRYRFHLPPLDQQRALLGQFENLSTSFQLADKHRAHSRDLKHSLLEHLLSKGH
jgi:type I restriction enzyme S subunit